MWPGPWRHRLVFGWGMLSDDTEHTFLVAQTLLKHADDTDAFQKSLAWRLRWWLASLPAGLGRATLRACLKLWLGFPPSRSGVLSAGNGPAMRVALIGGYFHDDENAIERFTHAATEITHSDPRALTGAMAVARLAAMALQREPTSRPDATEVVQLLISLAPEDQEWLELMRRIQESHADDATVAEFAAVLGLQKGVTGYIYHTVPVAIYAWLRHFGDFRNTVEAVLDCGGDTDTTGAIAGALAGAATGSGGIPSEWLAGIRDWPLSVSILRATAVKLARQRQEGHSLGPVPYCWPATLPRNALFLAVVLFHGFRRLLPPY